MKWLMLPLVLLFLSIQSYAQWTSISPPVPDIIHGICFPDSQIGYINDIAGNVTKTTNGGITWSNYIHITSKMTLDALFLNVNKGFIAANGGTILKTVNGGDSWQSIQLNTNVLLFRMCFPSETTGYIVGNAGFIAKTTNGGDTWFNLQSSTNTDLRSVAFIDSMKGWAGGTDGLYKTTNGGSTWIHYSGIGYGTIRQISFPVDNIGYLVGDNGLLYKTTNQGMSWFSQVSPTSSSLNYAEFLTAERGYAVGNYGAIIATTNGGLNWINQNSGVSHHFVIAYFKNSSVGYCGGGTEGYSNATVLLKTLNGGFPFPALNLTSPNGNELWLNNSTHSITWNSQMVTYLNLDYTTNNGTSWISIATNYPATLNSYSWIVPVTPSTQCRVRIINTSDGTLRDSSENVFTINSITVTSPNGGESWQVLSNHSIKWLANNVDSVNLDYSSNNGSTWNSIIHEFSNTGTYNWTVPNISSNFCKVKVSDASHPGNFDISNAVFSITPEVIQAKIIADSIYLDVNFKSYVEKQVNGNSSIGFNLTYEWRINDVDIYSGATPVVKLYSGLNKIKLHVTGLSGAVSSDSMYSNVFASRNITGGAINSGVSQFANHFYITSADKAVYEIDSIGNKLRTFLTGGSIQSVLTISQAGKLFTGSTDTRLYAFDTTLIPLWDKATGGVIKYAPAISGDGSTVYCVTNTGNLIAYDVINGNLKWGYQTEGIATSSPVVLLDENNKNIIYAGTSSGYLYAIKDNGSTGDLFWRKALSDTIFSSIAVFPNGQNSLLFTGTKGGYLFRIKWDGTFDENWKVNLNSAVYSSPVIDGGNVIYIGTKSGMLYGYSIDFTTSSTPKYSYSLESGIIGTPAIGINGNIYVGTEKGYLFSLLKNDSTLSLLWKSNLYSSIQSSALVTESGLVYVGTSKGDVYVLKEPTSVAQMNKAVWPTYKGNNQRSKVFSVNLTGIKDNEITVSEYKLMQNYPNPFNPSTRINYQVPYNSNVLIEIYSITGERIFTLFNNEQAAGSYSVEVGMGQKLASGIYFYRMIATSNEGNHIFTSVKKMLLLK